MLMCSRKVFSEAGDMILSDRACFKGEARACGTGTLTLLDLATSTCETQASEKPAEQLCLRRAMESSKLTLGPPTPPKWYPDVKRAFQEKTCIPKRKDHRLRWEFPKFMGPNIVLKRVRLLLH